MIIAVMERNLSNIAYRRLKKSGLQEGLNRDLLILVQCTGIARSRLSCVHNCDDHSLLYFNSAGNISYITLYIV